MKLVMHASSLIKMLDGALMSPKHVLLAPGTARSEVLNLLYQDYRAGVRDEKAVKTALTRLAEMKIRLLNDRVLRAVAFATAKELHLADTYLAEYIALTKLHGDAFVVDDELAAEKARGHVEVLRLSGLPDS